MNIFSSLFLIILVQSLYLYQSVFRQHVHDKVPTYILKRLKEFMPLKHVFQVVLVEKQRLNVEKRKLGFEILFWLKEIILGRVFF